MVEGVPAANVLTLLGTLAAACVTGACLLGVALIARRTGQETNAQNAQVNAATAQVNTGQLVINEREFELKKEAWVTEISERVTGMAHTMLLDADLALKRAAEREAERDGRIVALTGRVAKLEVDVQDCEVRYAQIAAWARARGWEGL